MSSPIFSRVNAAYQRTSLFNLGHELKTTTHWGRLTPILCKEVLPGDTWRINTEILVRLAPMVFPIMHQVKVYTHFFFVPNRLLWDQWEDFITQSQNGNYSSDVPKQIPLLQFTGNDLGSGTLADYLGVQFDQGSDLSQDFYVNALPFAAYQKIFDDYYRDENLEEECFTPLESGVTLAEESTNIAVRYRNWKKDYFTSALPFVQKGPDITLPIGGSAPLSTSRSVLRSSLSRFRFVPTNIDSLGSSQVSLSAVNSSSSTAAGGQVVGSRTDVTPHSVDFNNAAADLPLQSIIDGAGLSVDLSSATAVTINELRRANALQRWEELNARGGTRYIEQLASHFDVRPQDSRLQRAQYLGGGVSDVVISEVLQTSAQNGSGTPLGDMAGHGISASYNHAAKCFFSEHGYIIGIMSIMPRAEYYQGVDRTFLKRGVYDFAWPSLAHLGEQPIYQSEIYAQNVPEDPETQDVVFGYTPRYAEYKFANDRITGDFTNGSLESFHLGRRFSNAPQLNQQFVSSEGFSDNVFSVKDVDPFWCQLYMDCKVSRKLPKFGTPRL